jgi:hypothetical protein
MIIVTAFVWNINPSRMFFEAFSDTFGITLMQNIKAEIDAKG